MPTDNSELSFLESSAILAVDSTVQTTTDLGASFTKMLLSMLFIVGMLFFTYWLLRKVMQQRMQNANANAAIQILEKRMLSPKTFLYLVEVEGKRVLMAESQLEVKKLETFIDPVEDHLS